MEPLQYLQQFYSVAITYATQFGYQLIAAVAVLVFGHWIARRVSRLTESAMTRRKIDVVLVNFLRNLVYVGLMVAVLVSALGQLGVNTTSFLAILGSAGLAVGLAMKDNLANFSSGIMLIMFRPFTVGDYVTVGGTSGTVQAINLSTTILTTPDNQRIIVPNTKITGEIITNTTGNDTRRIDIPVGIGYGDDIRKAREVIRKVLESEPRLHADPAFQIVVTDLGDSSVNFSVRAWTATSDYWGTRFDLIEKIKFALDENGISIPFPQRDIHIVSQPQ